MTAAAANLPLNTTTQHGRLDLNVSPRYQHGVQSISLVYSVEVPGGIPESREPILRAFATAATKEKPYVSVEEASAKLPRDVKIREETLSELTSTGVLEPGTDVSTGKTVYRLSPWASRALGYAERWRRVGRDAATRRTQGVILICGSKTVANIGDPSALAATLCHLQESGYLLENIIVLYDDTWTRERVKDGFGFNDHLEVKFNGRDYRSSLDGVSALPGFAASDVDSALRRLLNSSDISSVAIFYWNHGSSRGVVLPGGEISKDALAKLFVTALRYPGKDVFFLFDSCGSEVLVREALSAALKEVLADNDNLTLVTTSIGGSATWNTMFIELGGGLWQSGVSQAFRELCRFLTPAVVTFEWPAFTQHVNMHSQAGGFRFAVQGRQDTLVAAVFDPLIRLGDIEAVLEADDRLPTVGYINRLDVVRAGAGGLVRGSPLSAATYDGWMVLREHQTPAKTTTSLLAAAEAVRAARADLVDCSCGSFARNADSEKLIFFALEYFPDGEQFQLELLPFARAIAEDPARVDEIIELLKQAAPAIKQSALDVVDDDELIGLEDDVKPGGLA
jgi:hypothetical protein